jgi:hypothetical protein
MGFDFRWFLPYRLGMCHFTVLRFFKRARLKSAPGRKRNAVFCDFALMSIESDEVASNNRTGFIGE